MSRATLETLAVRCLADEVRLPKRARVLVAVSGGPDSMALLDVLARRGADLGVSVVAHGVDHGLRAEAAAELDPAAALARARDVPFGRTRVSVARGGNLQARAREARWAALRAAARDAKARFIATAHHADDRAETVLLRVLRGAGPPGLGVLPPRDGDAIRPLIRARRADVEAHVARRGLHVADDPSNRDPRFLRARVRAELLPLMAELDARIVEHLCALADALGRKGKKGPNGAYMYALPRPTQLALAALARNPDPRSRILLPGGLVALHDPTQVGRRRDQRS